MWTVAAPLKPLPWSPGLTADAPLARGLCGCWPLWEGGAAAADLVGRRLAEVSGAAWATGPFGPHLAFDGLDDYVRVPAAPALNPPQLTIAALVGFDAYGAYQSNGRQVLEKGVPAWTAPHYQYLVQVYDNGGQRSAVGGVAVGGVLRTQTIALPATAGWRHLAWTFDGRWLRGYCDGRPAGTPVECPGAITPYATDLYFARYTHFHGANYRFRGRLASVLLASRAMAAAEIAQLAADAFAPVRPRRFAMGFTRPTARAYRVAAASVAVAGAAAGGDWTAGAAAGDVV